MSLKRVELIRNRILRGMQGELVRLRNFISSAGENEEAVELLRGESGDTILVLMTDALMRELGHVKHSGPAGDTEDGDSNSLTRRAVSRQRRVS